MCFKLKLYGNSKNYREFLLKENFINDLSLNKDKELFINVIVDNNYDLRVILSNKALELRNNIYYYSMKIKRNNKFSKDYRIGLKSVIIELLKVNNNIIVLKKCFIENKLYYELFFNFN